METIEKMVDDDLIALKKTINYIFKQNVTANRNLMYDVFSSYILQCFARRNTIQHNITYWLYKQLPKIFRTNKYKKIVCHAVNKYFPNNNVKLFENFLIDNNFEEKYINSIFKSKNHYIPTDSLPHTYFLEKPLVMTDFWFVLHKKWMSMLSCNIINSTQYRKDYFSILLNRYATYEPLKVIFI